MRELVESADSLFSAYAEVIPSLMLSDPLPIPLLRVCGGNSERSRGDRAWRTSSPRMRR